MQKILSIIILITIFWTGAGYGQPKLAHLDKIYKKNGQIVVGRILKIKPNEVLIQVERQRTSQSISGEEIDRIVLKDGTEYQFPLSEEYANAINDPNRRQDLESTHVENSAGVFIQAFYYDPATTSLNDYIKTMNTYFNAYPPAYKVVDPLELDPLEGSYGFGVGFRYYTDPKWSIALSYSYTRSETEDTYAFFLAGNQQNPEKYTFRYQQKSTIMGLTFRGNWLRKGIITPVLGGGFDIYIIQRKQEIKPQEIIDAKVAFTGFENDARGVGLKGLAGFEINLGKQWAINPEATYVFYGNATTDAGKEYDAEMDGWRFSINTLYYFK